MSNDTSRPRVGVSACLLGDAVRFNGGHKRNTFIDGVLRRFVDFVPVCPEVESGMPVPRESLRLVTHSEKGIVLLGNRSGSDYTATMRTWAEHRIAKLAELHLDGFILKKDSPSCGLARVRLYRSTDDRQPVKSGTGVFAALLQQRLSNVPLSEEGWLCDAGLRDSFLERIFTHHRMRTYLFASPSRGKLVTFHTQHKLLYMAHSPARYAELGRLVANAAERPLQETLARYAAQSMAALAEQATPSKHANVLLHILGYIKDALTAFEKREVLSLIEDFRSGLHVLAVPLTLLDHHQQKHFPSGWLAQQRYFHPYPRALAVA